MNELIPDDTQQYECLVLNLRQPWPENSISTGRD